METRVSKHTGLTFGVMPCIVCGKGVAVSLHSRVPAVHRGACSERFKKRASLRDIARDRAKREGGR